MTHCHTREAILELVSQIPENRWWSLSAFVAAIHEQQPDFQRPAGDYDFVVYPPGEQRAITCAGLAAWDEVDGALVRFLITGPMHWLGLVDLALQRSQGARPPRCVFRAGPQHCGTVSAPEDLPE